MDSKRYYSRVNGSRFVFSNGSDCYFRDYYYETADSFEIGELDALTKRNNNPLIFVAVDGQVPQFKAPDVGLVMNSPPRAVADATDVSLAAAIAAAYSGTAGVTLEQIPEAARGNINQDVLDKINAVLASAKAEGIDTTSVSTVPAVSPEASKDPVVAALAAGKAAVLEETVMERLHRMAGKPPVGIPSTAAESNSQ